MPVGVFVFSIIVVNMDWWKEKNSASGLHSMRSTLQYMSTKEDINAQFSCAVTYYMPDGLATMDSDSAVFDIYCKLIVSFFFQFY